MHLQKIFYVSILCLISSALLHAQDKPNIVLVMCDDMGYSDLGCYGGEIQTPNIDRLAENGVRMTDFKNTGRCCPSRASLLTGRYQHAVGMGWMTAVDEHTVGYRGQICKDVPTVAELLKESGYTTYMSGKWHVTVDQSWNGIKNPVPNGSWPHQRGFDHAWGSLGGGGPYYKRDDIFENGKVYPVEAFSYDWYFTHAITEKSVAFINEHDFSNPLFMYVAYYAPHRPLQAPEARIQQCMKRYEAGYDILRQQRFSRLQKMGLVDPERSLRDLDVEYNGERPAWDSLSKNQQQKWIREMATFAAMVEIMDDGIGEIYSTLQKKGELENTVLIFISDNGATAEGGLISKLAADLSNTPYRSYKKFNHHGGISSPMIVHWPEKLASCAGELRSGFAHINDITPTLCAIAGGAEKTAFDGIDLSSVWSGDPAPERDLFFEHQMNTAVISDGWKMVSAGDPLKWELYHLETDPFEEVDLIAEHPEIAEKLEAKWKAWGEANHVFPLHTKPWNQRIQYYEELYPDQSGLN